MKSFATIILSFYFLLAGLMPNTDFHELVKLPGLVSHYLEHGEGNSESLIDFLNVHYGSEGEHGNNHHDQHDDDLPLHGHNNSSGHTHIYISFITPIIISGRKELTESKFSVYRFNISSEFLHSIFQPPKA